MYYENMAWFKEGVFGLVGWESAALGKSSSKLMNPLCEDQYASSDVNIASTIIAFWQSPEAKLGSYRLILCMNIICTNCNQRLI
jgi:hypothetical protein